MLLVILGSCASGPSRTHAPLTGSPENAEAAVRDWLTDRAGRAPDYGWSRLHPAVRTEIYAGDRAAYEQEAREVETGLWELRIGHTTWDGAWHVELTLLDRVDAAAQIANGRLIRILGEQSGQAIAEISVRMLSDGTAAIWSDP
jgi:hypothetical protein